MVPGSGVERGVIDWSRMLRADWNERPAAPYGVAGFVIAPSIRRENAKTFLFA